MKLTIYHNPRCRKSREALQLLEKKKLEFEVVKYLEQNFNVASLAKVLKMIGKKPSEVLRKNEAMWKKEFSHKNLNEQQILQLMTDYPKLIERPIVTDGKVGVLARPLENLVNFLEEN